MASFVDELHTKLASASETLLAKLPADGNRTAWVVPFGDDREGVTRLGVLAAEKLANHLINRGVPLAERDRLDAILREKKLGYMDFVRRAEGSSANAGILPAAFMIAGKAVPSGDLVDFTLRLVSLSTGAAVAAVSFQLPRRAIPPDLFLYVQRPRDGPNTPVAVPPMELQFTVVAQRRTASGGVEEGPLTSGGTMRSRDQFQLHFTPGSDCHVYLLLYGSDGKAALLFPNRTPGFDIRLASRCFGEVGYVVPDRGGWYWLDDHPGMETLYIVASYDPLHPLEELLKRLSTAPAADQIAIALDLRTALEQLSQDIQAGRLRSGSVAVTEGMRIPSPVSSPSAHPVGEVLRGRIAVVKKFLIVHTPAIP